MTLLREFNQQGLERFGEALAEMRADPNRPPPTHLLEDEHLSAVMEPAVEIDRPGFQSKRDAAEYLHGRLNALDDTRVLRNAGLWTWLTLFYFDDVCPEVNGRRRVLNDYYYIYEPEYGLHQYRHLLSISYRILQISPEHSRLALDTPLSRLGSVTESIARQLRFLRVPCMFEVLDRLYFDRERGRAKVGVVDPRPRAGDLKNRLPLRIRQLEKTYDLHALDADQMIALLGREFRVWLKDRVPLIETKTLQESREAQRS